MEKAGEVILLSLPNPGKMFTKISIRIDNKNSMYETSTETICAESLFQRKTDYQKTMSINKKSMNGLPPKPLYFMRNILTGKPSS